MSTPQFQVITGDCIEIMRGLPAGSVDCCITSPLYPEIKRSYGTMTEAEWLPFMGEVMAQLRRVVKPSGSYWINIGPNSMPCTSRRSWPWRFVLNSMDSGHNLVRDCYWVKKDPAVTNGAGDKGLLRDAVEWLLWFADPECYRHQRAILLDYSESALQKIENRQRFSSVEEVRPSGLRARVDRWAQDNGGATPFNYIVSATAQNPDAEHPATFPEALPEWCIRYTCPPGGTVLDPFTGSGTTGLVAMREGRNFVGVELNGDYANMARRRIAGWRHKPIRQRGQDAPEGQETLFAEDVPA